MSETIDFTETYVPSLYGTNCFSNSVMRERLPKSIYKEILAVQAGKKELSLEVAEVVAAAMRDWALEKGDTHYIYWFHPLTGLTAEKHDSFISPTIDGKVLMEFSGFERHFDVFCAQYDTKYAATYGMYRLELIEQLGERFCSCGDYLQGVARIRCSNPECGHDYFRPFSCKGFYLCPSCSRKRTILFAEVSRLIYDILLDFLRSGRRTVGRLLTQRYRTRTTPATNRFQKARKGSTSTRADAPGPAFSRRSRR